MVKAFEAENRVGEATGKGEGTTKGQAEEQELLKGEGEETDKEESVEILYLRGELSLNEVLFTSSGCALGITVNPFVELGPFFRTLCGYLGGGWSMGGLGVYRDL